MQNGTDKLLLNYSYGDWNGTSIDATKNNGNIVQQVITVPTVGTSSGFVATQKYYYDELNRIDDAIETIGGNQTWRQDFSYDRYGNRNLVEANTTTLVKNCGTSPNFVVCTADKKVLNPSVSPNTNRIIQDQDNDSVNDYLFDAGGSTTKDASDRTFIYDGENKQVEVRDSSNNLIGQYVYNGDGQRVKKIVPATGEVTLFVYDAAAKLVAEYSTIVEPASTAKVAYLTNDHLGSPRINTDANGTVIARHDYHPFGEEIATSHRVAGLGFAPDNIRKQFIGYEQDVEIDLDYAQARYYHPGHGRFTSPDDFTNDTHPADPASWNLYVYVRNNPLGLTDPSGEEIYAGNITDPKDRDEFLRRANYTYGCQSCVTIDKKGYVRVDTTGLNKDVIKATQYLTEAINSKDLNQLFSVTVTNNNKDVAFGDSQAGAGKIPGVKTTVIGIRLDFADDKPVSGDSKSKEAFLNLVFAHEVAHFAPDYIQDPKNDRNKTGPVVDKVNEIQEALGLPLRAQYSASKTSGGNVWVEVSFGKAKTDKSGQILRDGTAIRVEKQNKVVRWVRSIVGGKGIN